ncbi:hypothetical protein THARTR1_06692 [Trichoderma harzianum]|uniref:Uncharacterized protein n=1 Tax=Trichoderma harzianum TaxID=5544 RepID=A0A2K0U508_TRIHA|nr:hypothetical protein THARTR1_06692 [Trichoderma harzianum]
MPTYLCHGFRWTRRLIRIWVIMQDLDDAAPDWITGRTTSAVILERFATKFDYLPQRPPSQQQQQQQQPEQNSEPQQEEAKQGEKKIAHQDDDLTVPPSRVPDAEDSVLVNQASPVKLLEEYDPEETVMSARPFAYVADHVIRIDLSANVLEEMAKYEALVKERDEGNWLERLRDDLQMGLQKGPPIGWYVVVNGDEERSVPEEDDEESFDDEMRDIEELSLGDEGSEAKREQQPTSPSQQRSTNSRSVDQQHSLRHKISRAGLRRLFSKKEAPE